MRQLCIGFVVLVAFALAASAQEQPPQYDLETVLQKALGTNELVEQAREDLQTAELLRRAAWSAFIPDAEILGSLVRNDQEIAFNFDGMDIAIQNAWDYSTTVQVSSPIYQGGFLFKTVEQSGINIGINQDLLTQAQLDLIFQVAAGYALVVKAQREVEIAQVSLDLAQRQLEQAKVLFEAGEAVRVSVLRAEAEVANAEGGLIRTKSALEKAKTDLEQLVPLGKPFMLTDVLRTQLPAQSEAELVALGLANRIELKALDKQLDFNQLDIEKEFSAKLPQVDWAFQYVKQRSGFPTDTFWRVNLNFSLNLYDSGVSTIRKAQRESERRKLKLGGQLLERQIKAEVIKAWLDYQDVLQGKIVAEKALRAARQAYEDIERFFKVGEATDLDLQDARRTLINAEISNTNLETDEKIALLQLRYVAGLPAVEVNGSMGQ